MTTKMFLSVDPRWPGEYLSVVSCGLSTSAFVLLLSLFIYEKCHAHYACPRTTCSSSYYFRKIVFVNILIRVIKKNNKWTVFMKKWRSRVTILLLPIRHSIFHVQGRQLCNSSAIISNGQACSRDTSGNEIESQGAVIRTMPKYYMIILTISSTFR
jgi:hypothetical protein